MRIIIVCLISITLMACAATPVEEVPTTATTKNERAAILNTDLGAKYMASKDFQLADDKLRRALNQDPSYAPAHWTYALLQERLGQFEEAEKYYRSALRVDPKDSSGNNNYGTFLCKHKRYQEADKYFKAAIADPLYRNRASSSLNAGVCAMQIPDYDSAQDYFEEVLRLQPGQRVALYQIAKLHFEKDELIKARGYMLNFEKNSKHTSESLWLAYRIEDGLGNRPEADAYASQLASNFPNSNEARELTQVQ